MKNNLLFLLCMVFGCSLAGQIPNKPQPPKQITPSGFQIENFRPAIDLSAGVPRAARKLPERAAFQFLSPTYLNAAQASTNFKVKARSKQGMPIVLEGRLPEKDAGKSLTEQAGRFLNEAAPLLGIKQANEAFELMRVTEDELGMTHFRFRQMHQGVPVYGGEVLLHARDGRVEWLNGRAFPSPEITSLSPELAEKRAREIALEDLAGRTTLRELRESERHLAHNPDAPGELIIYHHELDLQGERLVWRFRLVPNVLEHWQYFVDAHTGEVINAFRASCTLAPHDLYELPATPPAVGQGQDLKGANRSLNTFEQNGAFFLIDASRDMFNAAQSTIPDDPVGVIMTLDALNTNPANDDFQAAFIVSNSNTWTDPTAVSAHYNAQVSYEYFFSRFDRNSINGSGGNVISLINVSDQDGSDFDNAFWNGKAMFYGNGNQAFSSPLAKSLDVGGHEMTHGVIQNTANLTYQNQSGALNESFADVFGVLIDDANFLLGEDVVNPAVYPTGAMRDMADPNNGGNSLRDIGWQPAHMNEFQDLSIDQDNGGVHINSGIPNRAFFLFISEVGAQKAERVYYRALEMYLTASSQFIDCRLAVIQAATDLFGANSPEVTAAANAFNQVGILDGNSTDEPENLPLNDGQEFIMATDGSKEGLYLYDFQQVVQLSSSGLISRPSVTDDGSVIVFVAADNTLRTLIFNPDNGNYEEFFIEQEPQQIWRNIAISKDGSKIAMLTTDFDNRLEVFDFNSGTGSVYELVNPTTAPGANTFTNDVAYADVLEWDYSGEFVMYDALNQINATTGGVIDYWDIGLIRVWNNSKQNFGDGFIFKVFSSLPDNASVGNPAFAKNSPEVIAFDFVGNTSDFTNISTLAANTQTGEIGVIREGIDVLGIPNFSTADDAIILNNSSFLDGATIDVIPLASDKLNAAGAAQTLLTGAQQGLWFATGRRDLSTSVNTIEGAIEGLQAQPNPFAETLQLVFESAQSGRVEVQLFDPLGRLVRSEQMNALPGENNLRLSTPGLPKGMYVVRLQTPEGMASVKVVKE